MCIYIYIYIYTYSDRKERGTLRRRPPALKYPASLCSCLDVVISVNILFLL